MKKRKKYIILIVSIVLIAAAIAAGAFWAAEARWHREHEPIVFTASFDVSPGETSNISEFSAENSIQ